MHPRVPTKREVSGILSDPRKTILVTPIIRHGEVIQTLGGDNPKILKNNFSNPPNQFQPNGSIPNRSFNNNPQSFNNQSNLKGLVSNFMASQDARLSKFEADFKQQQSEMTNKINTVLKAITDRIAGALPSDTVKNPKLNTSLVLSTRSYPTEDPQCSTQIHSSINAVTICPKQPNKPQNDESEEEEREREGNPKDTNTMAHNEEQGDTPQ
ncbi:hypothetical protein Tco_0695140 [Tanacetum coccineum]